MRRITLLLSLSFLGLFLFLQNATAAPQERRVALVIGNAAYRVGQLRNPGHDAEDIGSTLRKLGFEVQILENASKQKMDEAVILFADKLKTSTLGLFYFSGHGVQLEGINYLVPIDKRIQSDADVLYGCLNAQWALKKMEDAGRNKVNIVILDACRDNPFLFSSKSVGKGLAAMPYLPGGAVVGFATAAGHTASDGSGRNGTYTKHLLQHLTTPGLSLMDVLMQTSQGVITETDNTQVPWLSSSLPVHVYLAGLPRQAEGTKAERQKFIDRQGEAKTTERQKAIDRLKSVKLDVDQFWVSYRIPFDALGQPAFDECVKGVPNIPRGSSIEVSKIQCIDSLKKNPFNSVSLGFYITSADRKEKVKDYRNYSDKSFFVNSLNFGQDQEITLTAQPDASVLTINTVKLGNSANPLSSVARTVNINSLYDLLGAIAHINVQQRDDKAVNDALTVAMFSFVLKGSNIWVNIAPRYITKVGTKNGQVEWVVNFPEEPLALIQVLGLTG